jgi:hypothetical protein
MDYDEFNTQLSKLTKKLKKEAGVATIRQNYKGTGSQKPVRQLWVNFKDGSVIDIWLKKGSVQFGGVVANSRKNPDTVPVGFTTASTTPEVAYEAIKKGLIAWTS